MVPFDTRSPFVTSGIRLGTAALTTKGMKEKEMQLIAKLIDTVLKNIENDKSVKNVLQQVIELSRQFPLYSF
jgi:glycine hydroxymethyltransferase